MRAAGTEKPPASTTPYPPTDSTAVLSAKRGLTAEFGMGSGDPPLYGRARRGLSLQGSLCACQMRTLGVAWRARIRSVSPDRVDEELGRLVPLA